MRDNRLTHAERELIDAANLLSELVEKVGDNETYKKLDRCFSSIIYELKSHGFDDNEIAFLVPKMKPKHPKGDRQ